MLTLKTIGILELKKNPGVHSGIFQSSLFKQLNEFLNSPPLFLAGFV